MYWRIDFGFLDPQVGRPVMHGHTPRYINAPLWVRRVSADPPQSPMYILGGEKEIGVIYRFPRLVSLRKEHRLGKAQSWRPHSTGGFAGILTEALLGWVRIVVFWHDWKQPDNIDFKSRPVAPVAHGRLIASICPTPMRHCQATSQAQCSITDYLYAMFLSDPTYDPTEYYLPSSFQLSRSV